MRLQLEDSALEYLAQIGFDPVFGARPVKRALQRELQTLLAKVLCVCMRVTICVCRFLCLSAFFML